MNDSTGQPRLAPQARQSGVEPVTIIVAFHFHPSPQVGARRMTALARYLKAHGRQVLVVSAFAGLAGLEHDPARAILAEGERAYVPDRESRTLAFLIALKRWLRSLAARSGSRKSAQPATTGAGSGDRPGDRGPAWYRPLLALLQIVDSHKDWAMRSARVLARLAVRYPHSVVVVSVPPVSPAFTVVRTAHRLRLPVILDLRDPICGAQPTADARLEWSSRGLIEHYVLPRADAVVTTSPGLRAYLRARYPAVSQRIHCIPNGFDAEPAAPMTRTGNRLTMVYAGELYVKRNPFPFLEAIDRLLAKPEVDASLIRVVFAGECERYGAIVVRDWAATRVCGRVLTIHPHLDSVRLKQLYEEATLLLNFAEGQPMQVPAKTFELLSLGREMLVLCEPGSDTAATIHGLDGVFAVRSSDSAGLDALLDSLYRSHVVEGRASPPATSSVAPFARDAQNERLLAVIDSLSGERAAARPR